MEMMKCEQCGRMVDDTPCPYCQSTRVRPLRPEERESEAPPPPPRETPPPRPQRWIPEEKAAPPPPPPAAAETREIQGLAEFEALLTEEHYQAVVICGMSQSGKSEIASGFTRANAFFRSRGQVGTQRTTSKQMYTLGGTNPDEVWFQPVNTSRKIVFLDPSGEFFRKISPTERQRLSLPDPTPEHFRFVRAAVEHLAGIVLVLDLTNTLDDSASMPWLNQEKDLEFTLNALRVLRYAGDEATQLSLSSFFATRVHDVPRLDVPVLALFSKADLLGELSNEPPLRFARRKLPTLHTSLVTHARRFRFDFVHTMTEKPGVGLRQAERPCGVLLAMEWLLADPFRWLPSIPTRFLETLG